MPMLFPEAMMDALADRAACRALLRTGSRTFYAASHLLPRPVRESATALYAFCRVADDAIDLQTGSVAGRRAALERLQGRLDRVYAGQPRPQPADRAFAATVEGFAIPRELPDALLEGLAWDVEERRYETLADLHAYAARVAGSVGVMMALVMGIRDRAALGRACQLGMAMQLTNIARDIGEDARAGRLYVPLSWMRAAGHDPDAWLAAPAFDAGLRRVAERLLEDARGLYLAGEAGIAALPPTCRIGIRAARLLYAAIGDEVARRGYNSVDGRARVADGRKLGLLALAAIPVRSPPPSAPASNLSCATFLVDCVRPVPNDRPRRASPRDHAAWVLDLFERVERRRLQSSFDGPEAA